MSSINSCKDTPPNSYLRTGVPLIYAFALFPLVIPVIDPPEAPVYLITSSPICNYPGFVAPTETFSNVVKLSVLTTDIVEVEVDTIW